MNLPRDAVRSYIRAQMCSGALHHRDTLWKYYLKMLDQLNDIRVRPMGRESFDRFIRQWSSEGDLIATFHGYHNGQKIIRYHVINERKGLVNDVLQWCKRFIDRLLTLNATWL